MTAKLRQLRDELARLERAARDPQQRGTTARVPSPNHSNPREALEGARFSVAFARIEASQTTENSSLALKANTPFPSNLRKCP